MGVWNSTQNEEPWKESIFIEIQRDVYLSLILFKKKRRKDREKEKKSLTSE